MTALLRNLPFALRAPLSSGWERRWTILGCAWALSILGWVAVAVLPDSYQATMRIYVETENLLTPLLRNIAVQADMRDQQEAMREILLSRDSIVRAAHAGGLDAGLDGEVERERQVERLKKNVLVVPEGRNLFFVSYRNRDPLVARAVVDALLANFVEVSVGHNRQNMEGARTFIESQIADYERQLKQAERRMAEYKSQHLEVVMAIGGNFAGRLEAARDGLAAARQKYEDAVIARDQLRAQLAAVPAYIAVDTQPQVVVNGGAVADSGPLGRLRRLEAELAQLTPRYTDRHPDVVALRAAIAQARAAVVAEPAAGPDPTPRGRIANTVYDQLKLRLIQAEGDVATTRSHLQVAGESLKRLSALGETAPKVEADLADLNREYGVLKSRYEDLLGRRESARISEAAGNSGDKGQFRVIEAPQVPALPIWPNRPLLAALAFLVALGAGIGAAFVLHQLDDTVSTAQSLERFGMPVLGFIPKVETAAGVLLRRTDSARFAVASSGLVLSFGLILVLFHYSHLFFA